jgi:PAS domain S-box-containing protein
MFDRLAAGGQLQILFESAPHGVIALDHDGRIVLLNAQMEKSFGYGRDELIGQPVETLVPEPLRRAHSDLRRKFTKTGQARPMGVGGDLFGRRKDGSEFPIEIGLNPVGHGAEALVLATVVDITERKRAERDHKELLRGLAHALYQERLRLSHELHDQAGQGLVAITLELKRLEPEISEPGRHRLHGLREKLDELGRMLHRIAWELRPATIEDLGLAGALADHLSTWSAQTGIQAAFQCGDDPLDDLTSDTGTLVFRVVQEALTNIAKHAANSTSVSIVIDRTPALLRLTIEDNGRGFDPSLLTRRPLAGARPCLGIAGMRGRLSMFGGEFEIESSPGVGTTIFASIPLEPETASCAARCGSFWLMTIRSSWRGFAASFRPMRTSNLSGRRPRARRPWR